MLYKVDVIIPSYKPDGRLKTLIEKLESQSYPVNKIIIMNTEEKYFDRLFYGSGFLEKYKNIEVHHISAKEFDHGKTRGAGVKYSQADIFVCMTQDATPADDRLIEQLVDAITSDNQVAAAYAKQLPYDDCRAIERFTRSFNYPDTTIIKSQDDIQTLGIKTFFCSNVCAAYRRNVYDELGGFVKKAIFNEDMIYAGNAVYAGKKIVYKAEAKVYHSHNYSCMQQFKRNFDLGVSQAEHPEIFASVSSESEGMALVKKTVRHLISIGKGWMIPYFIVNTGCKFLGYKLGIHYKSLPYGIIIRCTNSKLYWNQDMYR